MIYENDNYIIKYSKNKKEEIKNMLTVAIHFKGNCNEAIKFYKETLGAKVKEIALFKDAPDKSFVDVPLPDDFVMHSNIEIFGATFSLTDGADKEPNTGSYSFMITLDSDEEVNKLYDKLVTGGKVIEPLGEVFWSSMYAMIEDKFGVTWQIMTKV